jgi:hypothetical protein
MSSVVLAVLASLVLATTSLAVAGWGPRESISPRAECFSLVATVDNAGAAHAAALCDDDIVAFDRTGTNWTTRIVASTGINSDPQIAVDGDTLYVAFSHNLAVTCALDMSRPGVYVRQRTLPDGAWSALQFVGNVRDRVRSFRVVDGSLHAVVEDSDEVVQYETDAAGPLLRYPIPDASGSASLRIGSDGRARIAYETETGLSYATFTGKAFKAAAIPGTNDRDGQPQLVLDGKNQAHVSWTHDLRFDGGCAEPDNKPSLDGTYYATNASGSWTAASARRITPRVGPTSIALGANGQPTIVVGSETGVRVYSRAASGAWSGQTVSSLSATDVAIRFDPASGRPIALFGANGHLYAVPGV